MKIGTCYICGNKGPIHEHHVWLQAAGGSAGPVVNLCATDHQKIHTQSLNAESKAEKVMLFSPEEWKRAKPLVDYIILALRKNRDNPDFNNPSMLQIKLTKQDVFLLHLMKSDRGYTSLQKFMQDLIKGFIEHKFPTMRE